MILRNNSITSQKSKSSSCSVDDAIFMENLTFLMAFPYVTHLHTCYISNSILFLLFSNFSLFASSFLCNPILLSSYSNLTSSSPCYYSAYLKEWVFYDMIESLFWNGTFMKIFWYRVNIIASIKNEESGEYWISRKYLREKSLIFNFLWVNIGDRKW